MTDELNTLRDDIHRTALSKGWYECPACCGKGERPHTTCDGYAENVACHLCDGSGQHRNDAEALALICSELLGELLECLRDGTHAEQCDKGLPITKEEEEAADALIRLLDYCGWRGLDIGRAVELKTEYNRSRPHKHGKEF